MIIGCPKEMKIGETRVALTPEWVRNLVSDGHEVLIQTNAGLASGFPDEEYVAVGGKIVPTIEDVYKNAEFVAKVKELMPEEFDLLQKDQIVMAWFHLAEDVDHDMLNAMLEHGTIGLGMELIKLPDGTRPTIKPMSEIAGSLAMLEAVKYGLVDRGGKGNLFRKLSGLPAPRVVIIGGGHAGLNAAEIALGLGLRVTIIENYWKRIAELRYMIPGAEVVAWEDETAFNYIKEADVLLNYTSLEDPIYYEEGILHYNVANMPALCPKTSTKALLIVSGPYIQAIANKGLKKAFEDDPCLKKSICTLHGQVVDDECARNHERACVPFELSMLD